MPPEVQKLKNAFETIPGISDAMVGKVDISVIGEKEFAHPSFAELPLGALSRTKGGFANEVVIVANFGIAPDATGLKALGLISQWVSEAARSGHPIQVRSMPTPLDSDGSEQAPRFTVDYFYSDPNQDMGRLLARVGGMAEGLTMWKSTHL